MVLVFHATGSGGEIARVQVIDSNEEDKTPYSETLLAAEDTANSRRAAIKILLT